MPLGVSWGRIGRDLATGGLAEVPGLLMGSPPGKAPGVGGPAADPSKLVMDPVTGFFYDPTTGTTYTDQSGLNPVHDPNVAQQVARNFAVSNSLLSESRVGGGMLKDAYGRQTNLANSLNNTINNPNAPSVSGSQLTQGMDNLAREQLSIAAGVGGPNAAAARTLAANNIGQIGTNLNQQQAMRRAQEVQDAQGRLAQVLNQQAGEGQSYYGSNVSGAGGFSDQAERGSAGNQGQNYDSDKAAYAGNAGFWNGLAGGASKVAFGGQHGS